VTLIKMANPAETRGLKGILLVITSYYYYYNILYCGLSLWNLPRAASLGDNNTSHDVELLNNITLKFKISRLKSQHKNGSH